MRDTRRRERQMLSQLARRQPKLLDELYDTIAQGKGWQQFLEQLVEATHSRSARLLILNQRADQVLASTKINIDEKAHGDYVRHFVNTCPWRPELAGKPAGRLYSTHLHFTCKQKDFYRTEFFSDWARHLDIHHGVCGTVHAEHDKNVQLLIQRTGGQGHYTEQETGAINTLIPHLQRVLRLARHLEAMRLEAATVRKAASHCPLPFLLLDERDRVCFISPEAAGIIKASETLYLREDRLRVANQHIARTLTRRLDQLHDVAMNPPGTTAADVRVPRPGLPDLHLILVPLHPDILELQLVPETCHTAIFLQDPMLAPELDQELLREMYGLTVRSNSNKSSGLKSRPGSCPCAPVA